MKFFIPEVDSPERAKKIFESIVEFNNENMTVQPLYSITYKHNGITMVATIGESCDEYYKENNPTVIAILKSNPYKICLAERGVLKDKPIFVSSDSIISERTFD